MTNAFLKSGVNADRDASQITSVPTAQIMTGTCIIRDNPFSRHGSNCEKGRQMTAASNRIARRTEAGPEMSVPRGRSYARTNPSRVPSASGR
ncbi:hypothetical protein EYF80_017429 [Liparis tanakae]|uniref:Uncharacterized protein n=1 Tax=Liparis tanakae TaxID=230148 RepID=A0A4Z2I3J9_9TELE|nr:hypothetical protein EYF80_017429 [Liparis tanakae]